MVGRIIALIFQWYTAPVIKVAEAFLTKENMLRSYLLGLAMAFLIGIIPLYLGVRIAPFLYKQALKFLHSVDLVLTMALKWLAEEEIERGAHYLERKLQFIRRKVITGEDSRLTKSKVSDFIKNGRFQYTLIALLNFVWVPFISLILTAGSFAFIEEHDLKWGFWVVVLAQFARMTATAAICYVYGLLVGYLGPPLLYLVAAYAVVIEVVLEHRKVFL